MAEPANRNLYEGMFLLDSGKFASNSEGVANELLAILEKAGAEVVAHRPWQDGKLAYEIAGHRKGLHYLVCFKMSGEGISELARRCKLSDIVLRHLVTHHPQSLFDAVVAAISTGTFSSALSANDESSSAGDESPDDASDDDTEAESVDEPEAVEAGLDT